jgi:hypothetical protein
MAASKKRRGKKRSKKRSKKSVEPKTTAKRAYRVESWFNGVAHEAGQPKGTQTQRPGWRARGTYAARKLASAHRKLIDKSEHVTTRIVVVGA